MSDGTVKWRNYKTQGKPQFKGLRNNRSAAHAEVCRAETAKREREQDRKDERKYENQARGYSSSVMD